MVRLRFRLRKPEWEMIRKCETEPSKEKEFCYFAGGRVTHLLEQILRSVPPCTKISADMLSKMGYTPVKKKRVTKKRPYGVLSPSEADKIKTAIGALVEDLKKGCCVIELEDFLLYEVALEDIGRSIKTSQCLTKRTVENIFKMLEKRFEVPKL